MPFKSEAQRRYLWANEPEIARDWTDTYGSGIHKAKGGRIGLAQGMSPGEAQARGIGAQHHGSTTSSQKTQQTERERGGGTSGYVPGIGYVAPSGAVTPETTGEKINQFLNRNVPGRVDFNEARRNRYLQNLSRVDLNKLIAAGVWQPGEKDDYFEGSWIGDSPITSAKSLQQLKDLTGYQGGYHDVNDPRHPDYDPRGGGQGVDPWLYPPTGMADTGAATSTASTLGGLDFLVPLKYVKGGVRAAEGGRIGYDDGQLVKPGLGRPGYNGQGDYTPDRSPGRTAPGGGAGRDILTGQRDIGQTVARRPTPTITRDTITPDRFPGGGIGAINPYINTNRNLSVPNKDALMRRLMTQPSKLRGTNPLWTTQESDPYQQNYLMNPNSVFTTGMYEPPKTSAEEFIDLSKSYGESETIPVDKYKGLPIQRNYIDTGDLPIHKGPYIGTGPSIEAKRNIGLTDKQKQALDTSQRMGRDYGNFTDEQILENIQMWDDPNDPATLQDVTGYYDVAEGGRIGYQEGNMVGGEMGGEMESAMMQSKEVISELYEALIAQGLSPEEAIKKIREILAAAQAEEPESPMMGEEFPGQEFGGGPRAPAAFGGIMDTYTGRRGYFLGSAKRFVKKAGKKLKKIAKSKVGRMALMYLATAGASNYLAGQGWGLGAPAQPWSEMQWLKPGMVGENIATSGSKLGSFLSPASETVAKKTGEELTKGAVPWYKDPWKVIPAASVASGVLADKMPGDTIDDTTEEWDEEKEEWDKYYAGLGGSYRVPDEYIKSAQGGRIGRQEGGLMDLGGMEKDYRDDGGFVPLGGEEKADDVPARLSRNEFVFTADAVRNAGGGDIDKGAEVMENVMKNLEAGGQVSEESQGQGTQDMFEVSERLSEVV